MLQLIKITSSQQLIAAAKLFQEYADSRPGDPALTGIQQEIATLPGKYAAPKGFILLAYDEDQPIGCVALHEWSDGIAEMKRLFVQPQTRGAGIGKKLVEKVINEVKVMGYSRVWLDTIPGMDSAQALYRGMGFKEIPRYRDNPNQGTLFFELQLSDLQIESLT